MPNPPDLGRERAEEHGCLQIGSIGAQRRRSGKFLPGARSGGVSHGDRLLWGEWIKERVPPLGTSYAHILKH